MRTFKDLRTVEVIPAKLEMHGVPASINGEQCHTLTFTPDESIVTVDDTYYVEGQVALRLFRVVAILAVRQNGDEVFVRGEEVDVA